MRERLDHIFYSLQDVSEYHRQFKHPSELQDSCDHLSDGQEEVAGLCSAKLGITQEPAFSRRRRAPPINPSATAQAEGRKVTFYGIGGGDTRTLTDGDAVAETKDLLQVRCLILG